MPKLKNIKSVRKLKGKRVLLRVTLNVPINGKLIKDDFRLQKILPTLKFLKSAGAKTIAISHLGHDGQKSLRPIVRYLNKFLPVGYIPDQDHQKIAGVINRMKDGDIFVLENLRRHKGEKKNDLKLAKKLSEHADIFVNEDFAASHRDHASIVGIPKYLPSYVGPLFEEEVKNLSKAFKAKRPFVVILAGAKFSTKIPLIKKFLKKADKIFISGALANNFFKAKGLETGKSLVDSKISAKPFLKSKKIILPTDVIVKNKKGNFIKSPEEVKKGDNILDIGPGATEEMTEAVKKAKFVLWNGPLGNFENGFNQSTEKLAKAIAQSKAESIVGGGDTIASIEKLKLSKKFSFLSTGGGAMIEFLGAGTLPAIEAIKKSKIR